MKHKYNGSDYLCSSFRWVIDRDEHHDEFGPYSLTFAVNYDFTQNLSIII